MDTTGDVWIIPFFPIWGYVLHFEHVSCVMNWWPKSVSHHLFSSPNWSLGLAGGKYYQKINIPILRLVLQNGCNNDFKPYLIFCLIIATEWHKPWWRHQIETFSALLAICAGNSPVPGEFPAPVTWSFDVFFDLHLNGRLSKQSWGRWFDMPSHPLWRHSNAQVNWAIISSENSMSPVRCQAIIRTSVGLLLIWNLGTTFNEIPIKINIFLARKRIWKCYLKNGGYLSRQLCDDKI